MRLKIAVSVVRIRPEAPLPSDCRDFLRHTEVKAADLRAHFPLITPDVGRSSAAKPVLAFPKSPLNLIVGRSWAVSGMTAARPEDALSGRSAQDRLLEQLRMTGWQGELTKAIVAPRDQNEARVPEPPR